MALPVGRFLQLARIIAEARADEAKDQLTNSAFVAWQLGAGGELTFRAYLRRLGLLQPAPPASSAGRKVLRECALADARRIVELDRRR